MPLPRVVIVGRPNVGKSSLLNWLSGRRIAIVDAVAGVTRDRVGALVQLGTDESARFFELVDTGGIGMVDRDELSAHVEDQIEAAINEADLVLFVVDAREGRMPLDEEVAQRLRYVHKPILLVVNKADHGGLDNVGEEFYKLGRGKPVFISVKQNRNRDTLLKMIAAELPEDSHEKPVEEVMKVAVVGRPNTGKSTFINTLAHAERMIVSEVPGTTRDAVDVQFELDGLPFIAIDTAGVRRKAKIKDDLDFYSVHRAERSIRRADVVLMFIDPTQGITRLDKQLADYISDQYKPCIFVVNKWDLIRADPTSPSTEAMQKTAVAIQYAFRTMAYAPIAFITGKTGKNVKALINQAQAMYKQASKRVSTGAINRVVREAIETHPPANRENKTPKVYYATQVGTEPPTLVLFVNRPSLFDPTYQRYLLNVFREKLPFRDIPIKLYLRARSQTEPGSRGGEEGSPEAEALTAGGESGAWAGDMNRDVNDLLDELED